MEKVGEKIRHYRKIARLTQAELAKSCATIDTRIPPKKWQQSIIGNYESNSRTPNFDDVKIIAEILNIPPSYLAFNDKNNEAYPISNISSEQDENHAYQIDFLDVEAAAGHTSIVNADYPEIITSIYFSQNGLLEIVGRKSNKGLSLITIPTDSMSPTIGKGDVVFVDTTINYYQGEGIYIFILNDEAYIKRLQRIPDGTYRALSDNQYYTTFEISPEKFTNAYIIGKFVRVLPINPRDL